MLIACVGLLIASCAPPRDILSQWDGVFVQSDDQGFLDRGCEVDANNRTVTEWWYEEDGTISREEYGIVSFELIDQYSRNYGTFRPTWIYRYDLSSGGVFLLSEYFDGQIVAHFAAAQSGDESPNGAEDGRWLERVPGIPELLRIDSAEFAADLEQLRQLEGRFAYIEGTIADSERTFRAGYVGYGSGSAMFGDTYVDSAELPVVHNERWAIHPVLRSQVMPRVVAEQVEPFERGETVGLLARVAEVRQDLSRGHNAVVVVYRYGEMIFE